MKHILGIMALIFLVSVLPSAVAAQEDSQLALLDDIQPYTGSFGANSSFYGLKLFLERVDVAFEFNTMKKIEKQMNHARMRLAEAKAELVQNRTVGAEKAIGQYMLKQTAMNKELEKVQVNATDAQQATLLEQIQLRAEQHNRVMQSLIEQTPDAEKLQTALQIAIQNTKRIRTQLGGEYRD